jgi:hypothetical protein
MNAIAYRAILRDDLCRWADEEWRVMAVGPCGIVLHNSRHGARSMNWTQFQTGKGSHLFTTDALNSDNPGIVLGGCVTRENPPHTGDVVTFEKKDHRVVQTIGEEHVIFADEATTLDTLIAKRAYYAARCVPCAIPKGVEV